MAAVGDPHSGEIPMELYAKPFVVEWFIKHGIEVWSVNEGEQRMDNHVGTNL